MKSWLFSMGLALALVAPVMADRAAEEDLAAVRKAVRGAGETAARAEPEPASAQAERGPQAAKEERRARTSAAPRGAEPRWLRVRIVEKAGKRGRVSLNLPIGLARAFGEDWPIQGCRRCENRRGPTLGELLRALDAGENLVEVEDEEATIRVWVD